MNLDPITCKLLTKFQPVCRERLDRISPLIIQLEEKNRGETIREILGELHTLKGESKMLGLDRAAEVVHVMESHLKELAEQPEVPAPTHKYFALLDSVAEIVSATLEERDLPENIDELIESLEAGPSPDGDPSTSEAPADEEREETTALDDSPSPKTDKDEIEKPLPREKATSNTLQTLPLPVHRLELLGSSIEEVLAMTSRLEKLFTSFQKSHREMGRAYRKVLSMASSQPAMADLQEDLKSIVQQQDYFYEQCSDLVFDMNLRSEDLLNQNLDLRLFPISLIARPFVRLVHDLGQELGKKVRLVTRGLDAELDKSVLEVAKDLLLHLVRNAIDHGLEPPEVRESIDKPSQGTLWLEAHPQGGEVEIILRDDGRGLDLDRIAQKGIDQGLVTEGELAQMTDEEKGEIIFYPDFSTAQEITEISGRGVGLDYVKSTVERLGGEISVQSERGRGTTFHLHLPLTFSLISALIILLEKVHMILPTHYVEEVRYITRKDIKLVAGTETIPFDGAHLPLHWLHSRFGLHHPTWEEKKRFPVIILQGYDQNPQAFLIDGFIGEREVILKPVNPLLGETSPFHAASVLENGELAYLVNTAWLLQYSPIRKTTSREKKQSSTTILLVEDSPITREMEKTILESLGYKVVEAEHGEEALEILEELQPDLVITDFEMPVMGGLDLCRQIRRRPRWKHLPIILVTTRSSPEDRRAGMESGANDYLIKGEFQKQGIQRAIERLIGKKR